jgi:uncharacterized protein (TIGR03067 family)
MRTAAILTLAAGLVATAAAQEKKDDPLAGKWEVESVVREGKEDDGLKGAIRVHDMGRYLVEPKEGSKAVKVEGTYILDTAKTPPTIDMKPTTGRYKDKTLKGIYKISENKLVICFAEPDKDRPKDFESKPGSGTTVATHLKAK